MNTHPHGETKYVHMDPCEAGAREGSIHVVKSSEAHVQYPTNENMRRQHT